MKGLLGGKGANLAEVLKTYSCFGQENPSRISIIVPMPSNVTNGLLCFQMSKIGMNVPPGFTITAEVNYSFQELNSSHACSGHRPLPRCR